MPRELTLLSTEPASPVHLILAAVEIDGDLVPRVLYDGWVTQLVDADDVAVISVELSRVIEDATDLERLTGLEALPLPFWLTEATAPWGRAGETGLAVMRALAGLVPGTLAVHEGG